MGLKIVQSDAQSVTDGNFGVIVRRKELLVPPCIAAFASLHSASFSNELLESLILFHGNLETMLGWDAQTRINATARLFEQLNGHTSERISKLIRATLGGKE